MGDSITSSTTPARSHEQRYGDITPDNLATPSGGQTCRLRFFLSQRPMERHDRARARAHRQHRFGVRDNGHPVQIPYGRSQIGIFGLTRSTARAVAPKGITVNCVIPGSFDNHHRSSSRPVDGPVTLDDRFETGPDHAVHRYPFSRDGTWRVDRVNPMSPDLAAGVRDLHWAAHCRGPPERC